MKTKLIILGLLVALAVPAFAQRDTIRSNKNELSFGYGVKPSSSFRYSPGHGETSHTLMFHLKINWLNTKYVNLYSKVGQGIMAWGYNLKEYQPDLYQINMPSNKFIDRIDYAYQFVPIGVEVGTKQYAGFIQCGLGMEGIISIGFRYGLKDKE